VSSAATFTFAGLRSRWMMLFSWAYSSFKTSSIGIGPWWMRSASVGPWTNSITRARVLKVDPIRNPTLFEMDILEAAGRLANTLKCSRISVNFADFWEQAMGIEPTSETWVHAATSRARLYSKRQNQESGFGALQAHATSSVMRKRRKMLNPTFLAFPPP